MDGFDITRREALIAGGLAAAGAASLASSPVAASTPGQMEHAIRSLIGEAEVRKGKVTTIDELRKALARRHRTTIACPITTGIFAWIAEHAAEEQASAGKKSTTPYWRTLKTGGEINPKYPGGVAALKQKLSAEGHEIVRKRDRYFVSNFADALGKIQ